MKDAFFSTKLSYYEQEPGLYLASKPLPVAHDQVPVDASRLRVIVLVLILVALPFFRVH